MSTPAQPPVDPRLTPVTPLPPRPGPDEPPLAAKTDPPRTVRELVGELRDLGVRTHDVLLVHCRLRGIGPVERGPAASWPH